MKKKNQANMTIKSKDLVGFVLFVLLVIAGFSVGTVIGDLIIK